MSVSCPVTEPRGRSPPGCPGQAARGAMNSRSRGSAGMDGKSPAVVPHSGCRSAMSCPLEDRRPGRFRVGADGPHRLTRSRPFGAGRVGPAPPTGRPRTTAPSSAASGVLACRGCERFEPPHIPHGRGSPGRRVRPTDPGRREFFRPAHRLDRHHKNRSWSSGSHRNPAARSRGAPAGHRACVAAPAREGDCPPWRTGPPADESSVRHGRSGWADAAGQAPGTSRAAGPAASASYQIAPMPGRARPYREHVERPDDLREYTRGQQARFRE